MPEPHLADEPGGRSRPVGLLAALLLASLALRLLLVAFGGQFYWPDETRYTTSRKAAAMMLSGRVHEAAVLLDSADHLLFKVVGLVPAFGEYSQDCSPGTSDDDCIEHAVGRQATGPACFFALFSVLNIWLIGSVTRNLGAGDDEALIASALAALSSALFYWGRHLVPYDLAMMLGLLALWCGTRDRGRGGMSLLCGCLAACAFLTYAGYWTLGGAALLVHVGAARDRGDLMKRGIFGGVGLAATLAAAVLTSRALGGGFATGIVSFARTVDQGRFDEGWRLPFEYLWHAEHFMLVVWMAAAAWWVIQPREAWANRRVRAGAIGLAFVMGALVVNSVFLQTFVVYGRLARQLVPFFCLLTAAVLASRPWAPTIRVRAMKSLVTCALVVQAAWNVREPLQQSFPNEFLRGVNLGQGVSAVYTHHIYPGPERVDWPERYTVLKQARHPLQFLPYQYEGYTPFQRQILRTSDIRMRIIAER